MNFQVKGIEPESFDSPDQMITASRSWARGQYTVYSGNTKVGYLYVTEQETKWTNRSDPVVYVPEPYKPFKKPPACFAMYNPSEVVQDAWLLQCRGTSAVGTVSYIVSRAVKIGYHEISRSTHESEGLVTESVQYKMGKAMLETVMVTGRRGGPNADILHKLI